jgi:hypothetical protein
VCVFITAGPSTKLLIEVIQKSNCAEAKTHGFATYPFYNWGQGISSLLFPGEPQKHIGNSGRFGPFPFYNWCQGISSLLFPGEPQKHIGNSGRFGPLPYPPPPPCKQLCTRSCSNKHTLPPPLSGVLFLKYSHLHTKIFSRQEVSRMATPTVPRFFPPCMPT